MSSHNMGIRKLALNGSESTVLKVVRDHAPISRSRVASKSGLALQAISRTVGPLVERGVLIELRHGDTVGRRRKPGLCISSAVGQCISVSYDANMLAGCVLDAAYNVLATTERHVDPRDSSKQEVFGEICDFTRQLQQEVPDGVGECLALAALDPGIVNSAKGVSLRSSTLAAWQGVPIVEWLEKEFGLPVCLIGGSVAQIHAIDRLELKGVAQNVVYVKYGLGVGVSLKLEGQYVAGKAGLAGEFGHTVVTDRTIPCSCGFTGCLEAVAAMPAIARAAAVAIAGGRGGSSLTGEPDGAAVLAAAAGGDRLAERIVQDAFKYLGRAVGGLVNTLDPDVVMFDSSIRAAGEPAVQELIRTVRLSTLPDILEDLEIHVSEIDSHVTCLGGAVAALDAAMEA